jgi:DNA-binding response OmpR family regulator
MYVARRWRFATNGDRLTQPVDFGEGSGWMKILVIDDDRLIRHTLTRILCSEGHEVITASDGELGMQVFRTADPEMVITDIFMPGQEGIETIRQMRLERPAAKILAISGRSGTGGFDVLDIARKLGADEVLPKPFGAAELLGCVQRLSTSSRPQDGRAA